MVPAAIANGAVVIALNALEPVREALGDGLAGTLVRGSVAAVADEIVRLTRDPQARATAQQRASTWLADHGITDKQRAERYRVLLRELLNMLRSGGSSRPLELGHLAASSFVLPARVRAPLLSEVTFPS
jgi:hypothetical protein